MTAGQPGEETRTAIYYIAETGLQDFRMGEAAAASWVLTLALMLTSLLVFGLIRERDGGPAGRGRRGRTATAANTGDESA
jgi:multiple sugar transport system permease protein